MNRTYFHNTDYDIDINNVQLMEIFNNQRTLIKTEALVMEQAAYYITQRYDLKQEFTPTGTFSITKQYNVGDRIILDNPYFKSGLTYSYGDSVIYNPIYITNSTVPDNIFGYVDKTIYNSFICITASVGPTTSMNNSDWLYQGNQFDIYNCSYPAPIFDNLNMYNIGDVVYWKGHTWSCTSPSIVLDGTAQAQFLYLSDVPGPNVFPDNKIINSSGQYWLSGGTYSIPIGTLPTNTNYWSYSDNRCQQVLNACLDMVIFYLERTAAPKNIPELRQIGYDRAVKLFKDVANGQWTITALARQPQQGFNFRSGGDVPDRYNW